MFESWFCIRPKSGLFVGRHCADFSFILPCDLVEFFAEAKLCCTNYEQSFLGIASPPIIFSGYSSLPIWRRSNLLIRSAATVHYIHTHVSFFTSALIGIAVDSKPVFESPTALSEWLVLPPLPRGVHLFLSDVKMCSAKAVNLIADG